MKHNDSSKISPPYIPWETFKNFLRTLKESATPSRIDYSMMPSTMSGFYKAGVTTALRFFSLIDSEGETTNELDELAKACETEKWPEAVKKILVSAYSNIIGDLQLGSATRKQLEEKFEGASATMKDRFIRFYIPLLQDAGEQVSPYLTARQNKPRRSGPRKTTRRKKHKPKQNGGQPSEPYQPDSTPEGMFDQPIPISDSNCFIRVPMNITTEQVALVKAAVDFIEAIAKQRKGSK